MTSQIVIHRLQQANERLAKHTSMRKATTVKYAIIIDTYHVYCQLADCLERAFAGARHVIKRSVPDRLREVQQLAPSEDETFLMAGAIISKITESFETRVTRNRFTNAVS